MVNKMTTDIFLTQKQIDIIFTSGSILGLFLCGLSIGEYIQLGLFPIYGMLGGLVFFIFLSTRIVEIMQK